MLEKEVTEHLGRGHYQRRRPDDGQQGYRNGYEPSRIETAEGQLEVEVPQVRAATAPHHSKPTAFLRGHSDVLDRLAVEMYARGLPSATGWRNQPP